MTVLKFNLLLPSELFRQQPKFRLRYQRAISGVLGIYRSLGDADLPTVIGYVSLSYSLSDFGAVSGSLAL
jgi:hypothetical protein